MHCIQRITLGFACCILFSCIHRNVAISVAFSSVAFIEVGCVFCKGFSVRVVRFERGVV